MSGKAKLDWALRQPLNQGDKLTLVSLVHATNGEGVADELDEARVLLETSHNPLGLARSLHSLASKGLLRGLRWSAKSGWSGAVRLQLNVEPKPADRHLQAVA